MFTSSSSYLRARSELAISPLPLFTYASQEANKNRAVTCFSASYLSKTLPTKSKSNASKQNRGFIRPDHELPRATACQVSPRTCQHESLISGVLHQAIDSAYPKTGACLAFGFQNSSSRLTTCRHDVVHILLMVWP